MKTMFEREGIKLIHGNSSEYAGDCDFVFTNPYAPLPPQLRLKPMLICDFHSRHALAEERTGTKLSLVSKWFENKNAIWAGNMPVIPVDLTDLKPEGIGWFPEALVNVLIQKYTAPGMTVWDGFMGRGTVGKACRIFGRNFIGIDNQEERVRMANEYIN